MQNKNVTSLLTQIAEEKPQRTALVFKNEKITFAQLKDRMARCAAFLSEQGLKYGDRAVIMIPMSIDLYVTLLAVIHTGATAVFVDPWMSKKQIAAFTEFAEPTAFIGIPKSHLLRLFSKQLLKIPLSLSTGSTFLGFPAKKCLKSAVKYKPMVQPYSVNSGDSALITFTSGSSGIPKGADRTHKFLISQYEALCAEMNYEDEDIDMPMFPVFALRNLAAGITSVIPDMDFKNVKDVNSQTLLKQIKENNVTMVTASPPFVDALVKVSNQISLKKIFTGGAPISNTQLEAWHEAFPQTEIDIIYGSTEAEPVAHISSQQRLKFKDCEGFCCGKPTQRLKTRIINITRNPVSAQELESLTLQTGEIGELIVSGEHVGQNYFKNPQAVKENKIIDQAGQLWHRMGDTGYFDESGNFFLTGRVHSTINRNGKLLHAQIVESEVQKQLPEAERVAALEIDNQLVIVVQGKECSHTIDADRIIFTQEKLPLDPRHNSKIDYGRLRNQIQKGQI